MGADVEVRVLGLPELKAQLKSLPDKLRRRVLRNALAAGARIVRNDARRCAPVLEAPLRRRGKIVRKPGTVRDAIRVRTSKQARRQGNVGVFVNVQPAKGGKRGTYSPDDPYYWRWLEFGRGQATKGGKRRRTRAVARPLAPRAFLRGAIGSLPAALAKFQATVVPAIARLNVPQR